MLFSSIKELVHLAQIGNKKIYEVMIEQEVMAQDSTPEAVYKDMADHFKVMKNAIEQGVVGVQSHSGFTGGDGKRLHDYIKRGVFLTDVTVLNAICYAIATNEVNSAMGLICATPTAGSAGVLPAALIATQQKLNLSDEIVINHLFTAGAIGLVIGNNACIAGATGGCQAEIGSASAMAAAAVTEMAGGTPEQASHAAAMALKNMLGLTCDPLGGLVEVPCIKRNAAGASNALIAAEMALAGIESHVPCDEVIGAMYQIGQSMPVSLKETSMGGLAVTPTGRRWTKMLEEESI